MHEMPIGKCNFPLKMINDLKRNLMASIIISYLWFLKTFDWFLDSSFLLLLLLLFQKAYSVFDVHKNIFLNIFVPNPRAETHSEALSCLWGEARLCD